MWWYGGMKLPRKKPRKEKELPDRLGVEWFDHARMEEDAAVKGGEKARRLRKAGKPVTLKNLAAMDLEEQGEEDDGE